MGIERGCAMGTVVSERERAISYVKDGLVEHFMAQDYESGEKAERFLCALEEMTDGEYLQGFTFCSCCNTKEERETCQHSI
jgi:hypothetical protein